MPYSQEKILRNFYYLALTLIFLYLVYLLRNVLAPFALAGLIAYAFVPAARYLNKRGFSWKTATVIIFLGIILFTLLLFFLIVPEAISQFKSFAASSPEYTTRIVEKIVETARSLDKHYPEFNLAKSVEEFLNNLSQNLQNYFSGMLKNIFDFISLFMTVLFFAVVVTPFALYYFLVDAGKIRKTLVKLFPPKKRREFILILREIDHILGKFVLGRFILSLFVGVSATIGLLVLDIEFPLLIGVIAGITDIIPYLGPIVGSLIALIFASTKSIWVIVGVAALFGIINLIEGIVVTPKIMGKEMGLHPLTVLLALLVGGQVLGALGLIIAIPVAGILKGIFLYYRKKQIFIPQEEKLT
ncbi:MAG: AI-2E family transporter [Candidatus Caldatribacteriaceae bacterium]